MILMLSASHLPAASIINEAFLTKINTDGDETSCSITADSKFFIFARKIKNKDNSDLYYTEYKNGKWSEAKPVSELNTDSDEISPYISPDGSFILFSSDREKSLNNPETKQPSYDIYYSDKKKGGWSTPVSLYGAVNTTDDELYPFITKDKNTLYFTRLPVNDESKATIIKVRQKDGSWEDVQTADISKNQDADIYMYKKSFFRSGSYITGFKKDDLENRKVFYSDDSRKKITELDIISDSAKASGDEISVSELSKDTILISSNSAGIDGSYDIYIKKISIEEAAETPEKIIKSPKKTDQSPGNFSLKIESPDYANPDGVKIQVLLFSSMGKNSWPVKTELRSPDSSGMVEISTGADIKRILVLPGESDMKPFAVEFLTKNRYINSSTIRIEPYIKKEFVAKPLYFGFNSTEISIKDIPYLQEMIFFLRDSDNTEISLEGYSDGIGSYKANLDISTRRAEKIKEYLVKAGIEKERIQTKGFGYVRKKASDTLQYNRRVETEIIEYEE